jgi:hypothetical protein
MAWSTEHVTDLNVAASKKVSQMLAGDCRVVLRGSIERSKMSQNTQPNKVPFRLSSPEVLNIR